MKTLTPVHIINPYRAWQAAQAEGLATVLWRLPRQQTTHLIVNFQPFIPQTKVNLEELPSGFVLSPFLNLDADASLFIEADWYACFDQNNELIFENTLATTWIENFQKWQTRIEKRDFTKTDNPKWHSDSTLSSISEADYLATVEAAIAAIETGKMQKVVLSRTKTHSLSPDFSVTDAFERLCQSYPNAFVSLVYLPQYNQIWLGATPETLVSLDQNGIFRTVSLAGTQSALDASGQPISPKQAAWTQKEIEEQAFVSRYIIECFKKIRVREFIEEGPKTIIAGNLMHLRTDYTVDTKAIAFPEMASVMLELLHPTSAVCGMPKFAALEFIRAHEAHSREFYSGFLGPVNIQNESHLFVNLRCLKIQDHHATLYAGGGITEDSDPLKEWQETELKFQTLERVLG
ncbi:MAG: chorismate-binding protein [Runella sp.]